MYQAALKDAKLIYETFAGWDEDITGSKTREDLPEAARDFVEFLEKEIGVPVCMISVGPERDRAIFEWTYSAVEELSEA